MEPSQNTNLQRILHENRQGKTQGVFSICSSHPDVLHASARLAKEKGLPWLVEATSNQVNQFGGYSGYTPAGYFEYVNQIAATEQLNPDQTILGGDHLGPQPWKNETAEIALAKARRLVVEYVRAGFSKIHLDTSIACLDDPAGFLPTEIIAERATDLCLAAEAAWVNSDPGRQPPVYIIGTEVPSPGGALSGEQSLQITRPEDADQTLSVFRQEFQERGLEQAFERVVALVVQPGVEFGSNMVHHFNKEKASHLVRWLRGLNGFPDLVFEAHSTDYQTRSALREMVASHFAILKVGPALTFAYREAIFALAQIEEILLASGLLAPASGQASQVRTVMEALMHHDPESWSRHYQTSDPSFDVDMLYSFSDRIRYYWNHPQAKKAIQVLLSNLGERTLPIELVSQYLPTQYRRMGEGQRWNTPSLKNLPPSLITDHIQEVLEDYAWACGIVNN